VDGSQNAARIRAAVVGRTVAALLIAIAGLLAATGWLYALRGLHWLGFGPRVADALPLLQLASADAQPIVRVVVAWMLGGALTGVALLGTPAWRRAGFALIVGIVVLLVASQAAFALTRNQPFTDVLFARTPGFGPVLEGLAFAAGCALPRRGGGAGDRGGRRRSVASILSGLDDRVLSGGEHRHAAQDDGDRAQVGQHRLGASA
jgi:hypothetical protein